MSVPFLRRGLPESEWRNLILEGDLGPRLGTV